MRTKKSIAYIAMLFMLTFLWRATTNAYATMLPLIAKYELGFQPGFIMYLSGIGGVGSFVTSFYLNHRIRRLRPYFMGSLALLLAVVVLAPLYDPENVWLFALLEGLSTGATSPLIISSAGTVEDPELRERAIALYSLALSTSLAVGPFIASGFLQMTGQSLRLSLALFASLLALSLYFSAHMRLSAAPDRRGGSYRVIMRPAFWRAIASNAIYTFPFVAMISYGAIVAREAFRVSYSISVLMYSAFFLTSFLARLYLTVRPVKRVDLAVTAGSAMTVLGLILVGLHPDLPAFLLGYAILGVPHGLFWPLSLIILRRSYGDEEIYAANSYYISMNNMIWTAVPFISGVIASFVGISMTFIIASVPTMAVFGAYLYLSRRSSSRGFNRL
ncbi:MAG: MFS transporter [Nitrososphaeria archaeon]